MSPRRRERPEEPGKASREPVQGRKVAEPPGSAPQRRGCQGSHRASGDARWQRVRWAPTTKTGAGDARGRITGGRYECWRVQETRRWTPETELVRADVNPPGRRGGGQKPPKLPTAPRRIVRRRGVGEVVRGHLSRADDGAGAPKRHKENTDGKQDSHDEHKDGLAEWRSRVGDGNLFGPRAVRSRRPGVRRGDTQTRGLQHPNPSRARTERRAASSDRALLAFETPCSVRGLARRPTSVRPRRRSVAFPRPRPEWSRGVP
jgi:hypothetical protein